MKSTISEKRIEFLFKRMVEGHGGICVKMTSPSETGWPDRIVLHKGRVWFVEIKSPDGELSARQNIIACKIQQQGCRWAVISSVAAIKHFELHEIIRGL